MRYAMAAQSPLSDGIGQPGARGQRRDLEFHDCRAAVAGIGRQPYGPAAARRRSMATAAGWRGIASR